MTIIINNQLMETTLNNLILNAIDELENSSHIESKKDGNVETFINNNNNNNGSNTNDVNIPYFAYLFLNPDLEEKIKTEVNCSKYPLHKLKKINDIKIRKFRNKMEMHSINDMNHGNNSDDTRNKNDTSNKTKNNNNNNNENMISQIINKEVIKWYLFMLIGPFQEKKEADDFQNQWKNGTRGIPSRIKEGFDLADLHNKKIWINIEDRNELETIIKKYKSYKE
jgi:hypothetical protein